MARALGAHRVAPVADGIVPAPYPGLPRVSLLLVEAGQRPGYGSGPRAHPGLLLTMPVSHRGDRMTTATDIRPVKIDTSEEAVADMRRRVAGARQPTPELVADRSQGVQLATIQELARYWATDYDWRVCEARLNALPQFKTEIDGVDVHFIHVKSSHADALPLIMTHGWPGSVMELLDTVGPLTDPTAHGGSAGDAFDLVLPSIPGYGFSGEPAEIGWHSGRVAQA